MWVNKDGGYLLFSDIPNNRVVKWQNGKPVTAKEVAWGMTRCMDAATFPTGACPYYSNVYFKGGSSYKGPYTSHQKPGTIFSTAFPLR